MDDLARLDKSTPEFVHSLFRGRCIICYGFGTDVNEIIPRSRGKASMDWHNRVLMCRTHHSEYHRLGASKKNIQALQELRVKFLVAMGREDYV